MCVCVAYNCVTEHKPTYVTSLNCLSDPEEKGKGFILNGVLVHILCLEC